MFDEIELCKKAQWDCNKITCCDDLKISKYAENLINKYPKKFFIKNKQLYCIGKFLSFHEYKKIQRIFTNEKDVKKRSEIEHLIKNFIEKIKTCENCIKKREECIKRHQEKYDSLKILINKYKNMANSYTIKHLNELDKKELNQIVEFAIYQSLFYFDLSKKIKMSTHVNFWIRAVVIDFFNYLSTGKQTKLKEDYCIYFENQLEYKTLENVSYEKDLISIFEEESYFYDLTKLEKFVINALYNFINFDYETLYKEALEINDNISKEKFKLLMMKNTDYKIVSKILSINVEKIKDIEKSAISKLKTSVLL
jgi:hypothetical protein